MNIQQTMKQKARIIYKKGNYRFSKALHHLGNEMLACFSLVTLYTFADLLQLRIPFVHFLLWPLTLKPAFPVECLVKLWQAEAQPNTLFTYCFTDTYGKSSTPSARAANGRGCWVRGSLNNPHVVTHWQGPGSQSRFHVRQPLSSRWNTCALKSQPSKHSCHAETHECHVWGKVLQLR